VTAVCDSDSDLSLLVILNLNFKFEALSELVGAAAAATGVAVDSECHGADSGHWPGKIAPA
jgi:hypothetical protein